MERERDDDVRDGERGGTHEPGDVAMHFSDKGERSLEPGASKYGNSGGGFRSPKLFE